MHFNELLEEKGFLFFNTSQNNRTLPLPEAPLNMTLKKPSPILQGLNYFLKANSFPSLLLV